MATWRAKHEKFRTVKLLVVGAGGIGCELLKNLAAAGFKNIHVIDLDTIDISNLNRQFLFRKEHVNSSKAEVATQSIKRFCPDVNLTFDHASIFEERFNSQFFKSFDFVLNALDNKNARNHVNRMCHATSRPLIESGSGGYHGQVQVIIRGLTECYECVMKPSQQKTFPGCTIRNTPSEHIHCTVWSKHVFNQLFGEVDIDDDVSPDLNDPENQDPMEQTEEKEEKEAPIGTRKWAEAVQFEAGKVFDKLFFQDIEYLCKMEHLWKERKQPVPLTFQKASTSTEPFLSYEEAMKEDTSVWSLATCANVFAECVKQLRDQIQSNPSLKLSFDKDMPVIMSFVAACANIRAHIFSIPAKSMFDIKAMAGNIIPAIAATNAMVAGMMVTEAVKLVHEQYDKTEKMFISMFPNPRGQVFVIEKRDAPNPKCYVCSETREVFIYLNPSEMSVGGLCEKVLKKELNMLDPDVMDTATFKIIISSEGGLDELLQKKLSDLAIDDGAILSCDDFKQEMELKLFIRTAHNMKGDEFEVAQTEKQDEAKKKKEEEDRKRKVDETAETPEPKRTKIMDEQENGIAVME